MSLDDTPFEGVAPIDDQQLREILADTVAEEVAMALKIVSPEVLKKVLRNLPHDKALAVRNLMDAYRGVKVAHVKDAQTRILVRLGLGTHQSISAAS